MRKLTYLVLVMFVIAAFSFVHFASGPRYLIEDVREIGEDSVVLVKKETFFRVSTAHSPRLDLTTPENTFYLIRVGDVTSPTLAASPMFLRLPRNDPYSSLGDEYILLSDLSFLSTAPEHLLHFKFDGRAWDESLLSESVWQSGQRVVANRSGTFYVVYPEKLSDHLTLTVTSTGGGANTNYDASALAASWRDTVGSGVLGKLFLANDGKTVFVAGFPRKKDPEAAPEPMKFVQFELAKQPFKIFAWTAPQGYRIVDVEAVRETVLVLVEELQTHTFSVIDTAGSGVSLGSLSYLSAPSATSRPPDRIVWDPAANRVEGFHFTGEDAGGVCRLCIHMVTVTYDLSSGRVEHFSTSASLGSVVTK